MYPEATDDTDAGLVDCDFVSSPFLPCGVREVDALSVTMIASIKEQKVGGILVAFFDSWLFSSRSSPFCSDISMMGVFGKLGTA